MIVGRFFKKNQFLGFPRGSMVKNLPANAGDTRSISDLGRSHMPRNNLVYELQLLSLRSRFREPWLLKPTSPRACTLQQEKPLQREAWASQLQNSPHSSEDPAQPNSQNNKIKTNCLPQLHQYMMHPVMPACICLSTHSPALYIFVENFFC